ncbi:MAG: helix-turn-helix domain-containing protein [Asticcacaulis sp.]|uniref:helix-turn-helix domain-containing protein n=1 Tax=Asticcacaulis sp. TaxID=1872648 RepID=UPI0039E448B6
MSTTDRVFAVLRLFSIQHPEWTVEQAASELDCPTSTMYRYFRSLVGAGLCRYRRAGL